MKATTSPMRSHLAQECTTLAFCWRIVRTDTVSFFFTSHDQDLLIDGDTYISKAGFSPTAMAAKSDFSVDNMECAGFFDDASITEVDLRAGAFDYADLYVTLANWKDTSDTMGRINLPRAKLGEVVSAPQGYFKTEVRGLTQLLQQVIVELYGPACKADVFDGRCGLLKALYECTATVLTVTDQSNFTVTLNTTPSSPFFEAEDVWFVDGVLQFTGGNNSGRAMEVKTWNHTTHAIQLKNPMGYTIVIGDTLKMLPGCDKSLATCRDVFNNLDNMRAESYLPGNDAVFIYPDANGGGV